MALSTVEPNPALHRKSSTRSPRYELMPYEIERKFLVRNESWRASAGSAMSIRQGYLACQSTTTRIRIIDGVRALLTIKSAVSGIRRLEFEYEIPLQDGAVLLELRERGLIEKQRFRLPWQGLSWEIDVFQGDNHGLVIAEIELPHEHHAFTKPDWLGPEVTSMLRYSNASLANRPFQSWPQSWRGSLPSEPRSGHLGSTLLTHRIEPQTGGTPSS